MIVCTNHQLEVIILCYAFSQLCIVLSASRLCPPLLFSSAGLEKFISTAKKLPRSDLYDVVEGYIKISMECAEIFKLLEGEKHVESEVSFSFSADGSGPAHSF